MAWLFENEQTRKVDRMQKELDEKFEVVRKTTKRPSEIFSGIVFLLMGIVFIAMSLFIIYSVGFDLLYIIILSPFIFGGFYLLNHSFRWLLGNNIYTRSKHRLKKIGIPCEMRVESIIYNYNMLAKNGVANTLTLINDETVQGCLDTYEKKGLDDDIYEHVSVGDRVMVYVHPKNPKKFFVDFTQVLPPLFDISDDVWE